MTEEEHFLSWKNNLFKALKSISDTEQQKLSITGQSPNIIFSFDEAINTYCDLMPEDYVEHLIKTNNLILATKFHELEYMLAEYLPIEMKDSLRLKDPQWLLISQKAREITALWK